ncbi:MAG: hypothetical protein CMJ48_07920 [Planctomycetaceae bacterium]|nr:hypothetical protein [Planctomycetaceae bacterium]
MKSAAFVPKAGYKQIAFFWLSNEMRQLGDLTEMSRLFHPLLTLIAASTDRALLPAMVAPLNQLVFDD